jgi:hypothetical protein
MSNKKTIKEIFEDEKAPVTALIYLVTEVYGAESYEWAPEVLKLEIKQDYGVELSDLQSDKIQGGITLLTTDQYENSIYVFETINYLFNNQLDYLDEINPLEAEELICGLTEAYLIRGEELDFSPEVRVYAGAIFHAYGLHKPPNLFPRAIMSEREGDDTEKNEALQEIFDEKIKITERYVNACIR